MLLLLSVITYLDRVCINSAAPAMRAELGMSTEQMGAVFAVFALAYAIFEIPGGWMGDTIGPRNVLTRIVVWWSVFTALTGVATGYVQLLVIRFLFGGGEAGAYPNSSATISRWLPARQRAAAHGWVWMASRLGGALSPLIVVPLIERFDWRIVFFIFSTFGLVWAAFWFIWFRDSPRQKSTVNQAEIELIGAAGGHGHSVPLRVILRNRNLWWIMVMYHCFCYGSFWFLVWTASYLTEAKGMDRGVLAGFTALPFILGAAANFCGGFTSDALVKRIGLKWGRRIVGAGGVGLAGILMLLSLVIANPYVAASVLALAFAASDFMLPTCWAVCLDIGKENAGAVTGAMNTAGQAGSAIVAYTYGWMVEQYGWNIPLVFIAVMSLISAVLWFKIDPTQTISTGLGEPDLRPEAVLDI